MLEAAWSCLNPISAARSSSFVHVAQQMSALRQPFSGMAGMYAATCPKAAPRRRAPPFAHIGKLLPGMTLAPKYSQDQQDLCGTWVKDREVSDSMLPAIDLMQLGGLVRQAVKLVRGIKIEQDEKTWTMAVFSVISWFKVTERYPLDGRPAQFKRRDLRKGKHEGNLLPGLPGPHGGLLLSLKWGKPHGGGGMDEFVLRPRGTAAAEKAAEKAAAAQAMAAQAAAAERAERAAAGAPAPATPITPIMPVIPITPATTEQELHVYSSMVVDDTPCAYRTVYHRKK